MKTTPPEQTPAKPAPFQPGVLLNGVVPWLFLATGPMMLILDAALGAGISEELIVSWLMMGPVIGGLITVGLSLWLRRPICCGMTLHGSLIAAAAMARLAFPEIVGGYVMAGVLVVALTLSGLASRTMDYLPLPIVIAMVIGVLMPFALRGVGAVADLPWLCGATALVFLLTIRYRSRLWGVPPTFWAAAFGIGLASLTGQANWGEFAWQLGTPVFTLPVFTAQAFMELSLPLTVMVIGVHGTQSAGIMRGAGFPFATTVYTLAVGGATIVAGLFGAAPIATMGPPLAMMLAGYDPRRDDHRWTAGLVVGALMIGLGLVSPVLAGIRRWLPGPLVSTIASLAVLGVLDGYLARAFSGRFRMGAMFCFVVTASGVSFLGIGAPLWGVLTGLAVSALVEPADFRNVGVSVKPAAKAAAAGGEG